MTEPNPVEIHFDGHPVNVIKGDDGKPWFRALDVCRILGMQNIRQAIESHRIDKGGVSKRYAPSRSGTQAYTYISEPNLYRLVCRSNVPGAVIFERWVFESLIPSAMRALGVVPADMTPPRPVSFVQIPRERYVTLLESRVEALETRLGDQPGQPQQPADSAGRAAAMLGAPRRRRKWKRMTIAETAIISKLFDAGMSVPDIGRGIGRSKEVVRLWLRKTGRMVKYPQRIVKNKEPA